MAAGYREDKVPKLRISFHQLERKCSELLLDGFESKPRESDLGDRVPSSSCNENDEATNVYNDSGQNRVDSPKKGGNGGLFQIKPTTLQAAPQESTGSQPTARRRRGSEQPERRQRERRFLKEDERGRFSEPSESRSTRSNRHVYNIISQHIGRAAEDAQQKYASRLVNDKAERERARLRRHTDDGRVSDQKLYPTSREEREVGGDGRKNQSEGQRSSLSVATEKESGLLADWQRYTDGRIQKAVSKLNDNPSKLTQILHSCSRLQDTGKGLLLSSLEVSARQEVSSKIWKCAHYPIIEVLRHQASETEESAQKDQLESFLKSSTTFYLSLVESIEEKYGFQLLVVLAGKAQFNSKTHLRTVMMALSVCEYFYIYLGDLTRYYEQCIRDKPDWSKPRNYYLKAQSLAPKDGKPYNQLAVVALNAHRRLDACYYYMRSLKAKVPFQSAMDRLVGLFEDASRKAKRVEEEEQKMKNKAEREAARKKKRAEKLRNRKLKQQDKSKSPFIQQFSSGRKEVWIMPGTKLPQQSDQSGRGQVGVANTEPETTVDDYYTSFTHSEVLKKLVSAFLVTHGKLFTKIGIELFDGSRDRLLHLWMIYWKRQSELTTGDTTRLLKMTVVNIFSIHNAQEMHTDEGSSRYYVGLAFSLALQLNTTLLDACTQITELLPALAPTTQLQCKDMSHKESSKSSSDHSSSIQQEPHPHELIKPTAELSLTETATSSHGVASEPEQSELGPPQLPQGQSSPVVSREMPASHTSPPCEGALLADASVELLCALDVLAIILPSVRVWLDWMRIQKELWMCCAFKNIESSLMHKFLTSSFAFINKALDLFPATSQHVHHIGIGGASLWEDRMMAGFMPLKADLSVKDTFSIPDLSKLSTEQLREQCVLRVLEMAELYKDLCDTINAIPNGNFTTEFDSSTREFSLIKKNATGVATTTAEADTTHDDELMVVSNGQHSNDKLNIEDEKGDVVSSDGEDTEGYESDTSGSSSSSSSGEDVVVEGYGDSGDEEKLTEEDNDKEEDLVTAQIQQLKEQRAALAKQLEEHKKAAETAESVLSEAASKKRYEVHIAPKYLVPDTNCYVDLLPSIKTLVDTTHFTVAVPLTVLAELEGLSKGSLEPSLKQNASKTTSGAKVAVEFINSSFSNKNAYIKALTTQGNLMSSISFRAEVTGKASNDDHILESCLNLHSKVDKLKANHTDAVDYYSVVLLTDDRNLRVKALANSLPARDLPDFMKLLTPSTK